MTGVLIGLELVKGSVSGPTIHGMLEGYVDLVPGPVDLASGVASRLSSAPWNV